MPPRSSFSIRLTIGIRVMPPTSSTLSMSAQRSPACRITISQVVPFPYIPSAAIVREYQQRMAEAGSNDYDFSSMEGFMAGRVLVEGLRRAGRSLSRDGLTAALESLRSWDMGGFTISYSPTSHEGSRFTDLTIIARGGKFVK